MQNIIFYIVVHNVSIIELFERNEKYKKLGNYRYLLVGNHKENHNNKFIIQCNSLTGNIEEKKYLTAYTAWYIVAKTPTLTEGYDYICFLEYDTDVMEEFNLDKFKEIIFSQKKPVYGISQMHIRDGIFVKTHFTAKLMEFLYKKQIKEITPNSEYWITTNNVFFNTQFLIEYFNNPLTEEFIKFLGNDRMSGHSLERFVSIYCYLKDIKFGVYEDSHLVHRGLDSHQTQGIYNSPRGYEQFKIANKISD